MGNQGIYKKIWMHVFFRWYDKYLSTLIREVWTFALFEPLVRADAVIKGTMTELPTLPGFFAYVHKAGASGLMKSLTGSEERVQSTCVNLFQAGVLILSYPALLRRDPDVLAQSTEQWWMFCGKPEDPCFQCAACTALNSATSVSCSVCSTGKPVVIEVSAWVFFLVRNTNGPNPAEGHARWLGGQAAAALAGG
jgi:hypothetical protein